MSNSIDVKVFDPEMDEELSMSDDNHHEHIVERVGIESKSCIDVMDTQEMQEYLKSLKATAGNPEDGDLEKHQQKWLASNAATGKKQRQLSHRELHNYLKGKPNTALNNKSSVGLIVFLKKLIGFGGKDARKDTHELDLVLARDWRQKDEKLPALGEKIRKSERDKIYNFDTLYRQVIFNFVDQVGQLPASESHHHNWPGGLLKHSLEVADMSFQFAKSQDIEAIGLNDVEAQRRGPWQYAAFIIGLLHDVGKSITDMNVHGLKPDGTTTRWNPSLFPLNQFLLENNCKRYFVDMNPTTRYVDGTGRFKRHEGMASVMLERILTPESIHFITSSPDTGFGLWEQITSILSGKSGHHYLESSLKQAEQLSVYRSFTKARSSFHLKDRRRSVAEIYIEQLHRMRKKKSFLKHVFNIGGSIFIRYPEGLNMIQHELRESVSEGAFVGNYTPNEILKFLESAAYIKRANQERSIVKILKTKFSSNKKNVRTYGPDGGSFTAVMLEHPTLLFGNDKIPDAITAIVYITEQKAIEFFSESECQEYVEDQSKVADKKNKSHKGDIAVMLDAKNKWDIVSHNVVEPEDVEVNGERIKSIAGKTREMSINDEGKIAHTARGEDLESVEGHVQPKGKDVSESSSERESVSSVSNGVDSATSQEGDVSKVESVAQGNPGDRHKPQKHVPKKNKSTSQQYNKRDQDDGVVSANVLDEPPRVVKVDSEVSSKKGKESLFDNSSKEKVVDSAPSQALIIKAYAEWLGLSEKNKELVIAGRIPIVLFQAPFFLDKAKELGSKDWASVGEHVVRKNERTLVLKQSFIDQVILLHENDMPPQNTTESQDDAQAIKSRNLNDLSNKKQNIAVRLGVLSNDKSKVSDDHKTPSEEAPQVGDTEVFSTCKDALLSWGDDSSDNLDILKSGQIPAILLSSGKLKDLGVTLEKLKSEGLFVNMKGRKIQLKSELLFIQEDTSFSDKPRGELNNVRPQDFNVKEMVDEGKPEEKEPLDRDQDYSFPPTESELEYVDNGDQGELYPSQFEDEVEYTDINTLMMPSFQEDEVVAYSKAEEHTQNHKYHVSIEKKEIMSMFNTEQKAEMGACAILVKGVQGGHVVPFISGEKAIDVGKEQFSQVAQSFLRSKMLNNACPKLSPEQIDLVVESLWNRLQTNNFCTLEVIKG